MTTTDMMEILAGILPIQLLMHKICHRVALRIASLPSSHPLHSVFHLRARRYIKTHRSPLHELADIYKAHPWAVKMISPVWLPPGYVSRIQRFEGGLHVAQLAPPTSPLESSMGAKAIQVFLDGSGIDGQVGAAVVLYSQGQDMRVLRYHLGALLKHMVFEAEAVGVLLALHLLELEDPMSGEVILTTRQS